MAQQGLNPRFYFQQADAKRCRSMNALKALKKNAPRSNEPDESGRMNVMQFFPRRVLRETFIPGNMCYTALRCPCPICVGDTTKTRKDADERTAQYIAENDGQLRILATLAFIGGTFATRLLCGTNGFNSVEEACRNIENRPPLQRDLFNRFILADRSLRLNDLQRQFQHSMLQNEQFLRTPIFQVGDPHRQFTQVQNYPFVNVQNIQVSHRTNTSCRLSSFRIYDDFCNSDLQGVRLFRKQYIFSLEQSSIRTRAEAEGQILQLMKDSGNGNVSQILFTYEEAYADARSYSLIFKHYPHDLNSILYRENYAAQAVYSTREEKPNRFPGSILDHWLWIGMLGVLDAVATFHDPPNHGIELPPLEKLVTAHLDIKPANILVDDSRTFRLGDFSHAYLTSTAFDDDHYLTTIPGDSRYRPPPDYPNGISSLEAQSGTKVASAYDIWSLACVLVEVICFVRNGEPDVAKFQRERQDEDSDHRGEFWKFISVPNIRVNSFPSHHSEVHGAQYNEPPRLAPAIKRGALKSCVQSRLRTWKAMGEDCDKYLARAIRQIELMFELGKGAAPTAKSCLQTLSSNVELDRYMFLPSSYKAIGSLGTSRPFEKMHTTFTTDRIFHPLRCSLHISRDDKRDKIAVMIETLGANDMSSMQSCSVKRSKDAFMPVSLFSPYGDSSTQTEDIDKPLHFCFKDMHESVKFEVKLIRDFVHLQGALTKQFPFEESFVGISLCTFAEEGLRGKRFQFAEGQMQIWWALSHDDYKKKYELDRHDTTSSTSSKTAVDAKKTITSRLAIYTVKPPSCLILTLTEDKYRLYFRQVKGKLPVMVLERASHHEDFPLAWLGEETRDEAYIQGSELPGIPLSEEVLERKIHKGHKVKHLEVTFRSHEDKDRFSSLYNRLFSAPKSSSGKMAGPIHQRQSLPEPLTLVDSRSTSGHGRRNRGPNSAPLEESYTPIPRSPRP